MMSNAKEAINDDFLRKPKLLDLFRWYVSGFVQQVASNIPGGATLLDAGAGECAYRGLFRHCQYKSIDLGVGDPDWNYKNLDYVGTLHEMPIPDGSFDHVLCTQVLEHLELPRESVAEMYRVLKPGGVIYISVPMAQTEHQVPYDFFRYTSFGLRSLCKSAGFTDIEIKPFGGSFVRWAYDLPVVLLPSLLKKPKISEMRWQEIVSFPLKCVARVLLLPCQQILVLLDGLDSKKEHPLGWQVVARKNGSTLATERERSLNPS